MIKAEIFTRSGINVEHIEDALKDSDVQSIAAVDMRLYDNSNTAHELYRGVERAAKHTQKMKLEIILPEANVPLLCDTLRQNAGLDSLEDIKIFTTPIRNLVKA